jgi:hypothetical protein
LFLAISGQSPDSSPPTGRIFQTHQPAPRGFLLNVCQLSIKRRNIRSAYLRRVPFNSSAFLYRDRYLVTAAHNVHSTLFSFLVRADVTCGSADAGAVTPQLSFNRSAVHVLPGYSFTRPYPRRYERDVAVVRLRRPICTGISVGIGASGLPADQDLFVAGFPGEDGDGGGMNGKRLYSAHGRLLGRPQTYLLQHDVITEKGNSGGPVWIVRDSDHSVVGIHVGNDGSARILDDGIRDEVNGIIEDLEAAQPTPLSERCPARGP